MKRARLKITYELLHDLLQFPDEVRIRRVIPPDLTIYEQTFTELVLEGDVLPVPEIHEGEMIPEISAIADNDMGPWSEPRPLLTFLASDD